MKKTLLILAVLFAAMVFTACDKNKNNDDGGSSIITTDGEISGKLKLVSEYENVILRDATDEIDAILVYGWGADNKMIYSETIKVTNGNFSCTLPTPLRIERLYGRFGELLSDKSAKGIVCALDAYKDERGIGSIRNISTDFSCYMETLIYVDRDVSVVGSGFEGGEGNYPVEYNVHLKKGWNSLVFRETIKGGKYTSNDKSSNMIWGAILLGSVTIKLDNGIAYQSGADIIGTISSVYDLDHVLLSELDENDIAGWPVTSFEKMPITYQGGGKYTIRIEGLKDGVYFIIAVDKTGSTGEIVFYISNFDKRNV